MDDGVPRQPGQQEEGTHEPQAKEHPQSLGHAAHGTPTYPETQEYPKGTKQPVAGGIVERDQPSHAACICERLMPFTTTCGV